MAISVATELEAFGFSAPLGPSSKSTISADEHETMSCMITMQWDSQTYAQADDATFSPKTLIEDSMRNGKTVTILQAAFVSAGEAADGTIIGAGACTVAANVVTMPLTSEDLSTEFTDATAVPDLSVRPLCCLVTFHMPV
jgi:ABC-type nitrate/sulfonate/bicarbonate transport system permease component